MYLWSADYIWVNLAILWVKCIVIVMEIYLAGIFVKALDYLYLANMISFLRIYMQGLLQVRKSNFVTEAINSLSAFIIFELCYIFN